MADVNVELGYVYRSVAGSRMCPLAEQLQARANPAPCAERGALHYWLGEGWPADIDARPFRRRGLFCSPRRTAQGGASASFVLRVS